MLHVEWPTEIVADSVGLASLKLAVDLDALQQQHHLSPLLHPPQPALVQPLAHYIRGVPFLADTYMIQAKGD